MVIVTVKTVYPSISLSLYMSLFPTILFFHEGPLTAAKVFGVIFVMAGSIIGARG